MKADEFIREVDEELRRDRLMALWRRYGVWLIAAAVAIVIGTAAGVGWRAYQEHARQQEAVRYAEAEQLLEQGRAAEAAAAFADLADGAGGGYAVLARLRAAEAYRETGDAAAAGAMLEGLAAGGAAPLYRDLGAVLAALHGFDQDDPDQLARRLATHTDGDGPWRYTAQELHALSQLRAGDTEAARRTLAALVDEPGTPANLRRRAHELLTALGGPPAEEGAE